MKTPSLSLLLLALPGCATLSTLAAAPTPAQAAPAPATPAHPVVTAENRLVLVPYGRYKGSGRDGTATLEVKDDQSFTLTWEAPLLRRQGQWSGTFEWIRNAAGFESLECYDVREAVNGSVSTTTRDHRQAVLGLDAEAHRFSLTVPDVGDVEFRPAK